MSEKDIDLTLTNAIIDKAMTKIRDRKPKSPTSVPILDDAAIAEIEAWKTNSYGSMVNLPVVKRDALCATVRQLLKENQKLKDHIKDLNHDFEAANKHCEEYHL